MIRRHIQDVPKQPIAKEDIQQFMILIGKERKDEQVNQVYL